MFSGKDRNAAIWWVKTTLLVGKCMAFPTSLANSQTVHLPVDSHQLFRTVACSNRSECTRCAVPLPLASLSECPGRLAMHGWKCVLAVCDGGVWHSSPLPINSPSGQLLSVPRLHIVNWVAWDTFIDRHADTLCNS